MTAFSDEELARRIERLERREKSRQQLAETIMAALGYSLAAALFVKIWRRT